MTCHGGVHLNGSHGEKKVVMDTDIKIILILVSAENLSDRKMSVPVLSFTTHYLDTCFCFDLCYFMLLQLL